MPADSPSRACPTRKSPRRLSAPPAPGPRKPRLTLSGRSLPSHHPHPGTPEQTPILEQLLQNVESTQTQDALALVSAWSRAGANAVLTHPGNAGMITASPRGSNLRPDRSTRQIEKTNRPEPSSKRRSTGMTPGLLASGTHR
jgi:hypothetical protein